MLGPHMVLESHCVDETLLAADLTLVNNIATGAGPLMELMIVPLL